MFNKTLDLIWGIWMFYRSKGFEARMAGNLALWPWLSCRVTKNTLMDKPWWWAHFTSQNLIVLRNYLFEKTLFWKPVLTCKTILMKNWSVEKQFFSKTILLKNICFQKPSFRKTVIFAVSSERLQFLLWYTESEIWAGWGQLGSKGLWISSTFYKYFEYISI